MQTTPQEVNRLTNIHHTSRIDGIAGAMKALGKTLEIRAIEARRAARELVHRG
jgi:antitoxin HicB